jgi:hypothetical protein
MESSQTAARSDAFIPLWRRRMDRWPVVVMLTVVGGEVCVSLLLLLTLCGGVFSCARSLKSGKNVILNPVIPEQGKARQSRHLEPHTHACKAHDMHARAKVNDKKDDGKTRAGNS